MSQFSVVVQVQRASKLANVTSIMLFLLSFYLSKLSTYTFDIELHIRTRHSSVSRPTLLTWSRPSLQHQGSKDYARNHKHTWNTLLHRSTRIRRWRGRRSSCRPGSRGRSRIRRHQRKVRTRQPCRITRMNDHTLVTGGGTQLQLIRNLELRTRNIAMLAGEIACWARLGSNVLARMVFAAVSGIEMSHGGCAVPVRGDGEVVHVVDEGPVEGVGREAREIHGEQHAGCVGIGCAGYGARD
jgi:hypothetical protein